VSAQNREEIVLSVRTGKSGEIVEYVLSGAVLALTPLSSNTAVSVDNIANFRFRTNGASGEVILSAKSSASGKISNKVRLNVSGKDLKINTYIANGAETDEEFYQDLVAVYGFKDEEGASGQSADLGENTGDDTSGAGEGLNEGVDDGTDLGEIEGGGDGTDSSVVEGSDSMTDSSVLEGLGETSDSGENADLSSEQNGFDYSNYNPISDSSAFGVIPEIERYIVLLSTNVGRVVKKIKREKLPDESATTESEETSEKADESSVNSSDESVDIIEIWQKYYFDNYLQSKIDRLFASLPSDSFVAYVSESENPFVNSEEYSIESASTIKADGVSLMKL
jgi:hypothetical protein